MNFVKMDNYYYNLDLCHTITVSGYITWNAYGSFIGQECAIDLSDGDFQSQEEAHEFVRKITQKGS